ncbi:hypothetical protein R70006_05007 [Paraburkholderia domus]|uniref:hypothetical protein n=1 Tax=Paraburkholderia domus TaxID=2793075 RepID=UPI001912A641|nr:hypothetical protein [Paraburkholderia domus]MBK5051757.1 hypothetical protein [Burkholderia sp. R-70006]CAE6794526.1 hypothetical protein R70006_05007 [Paraburkholderia domus]
MGIVRSASRFAGRQASYLVGYQHIGAGWRLLRSNWRSVRQRACPKCGKSLLFPISEVIDGNEISALGCGRCDYFEFVAKEDDPDSMLRVKEVTERALNAQGARASRERQFQISSRVFFALSGICLIVAVTLCLRGNSLFITATLAGALVLVRAMVSSYRCWQLRENRLFKPGSFKVWIKTGAWFV